MQEIEKTCDKKIYTILSMRNGYIIPILLTLAATIATGITAAILLSLGSQASMRLSPEIINVENGSIVPLIVTVQSAVSVNAFSGDVIFNTDHFVVDRIDYNTSIANIWVTEPWYNRASNTIRFAGGTTKPGGFIGTGDLMIIYLRATKEGMASISLKDARILKHDGLGSDTVLESPVDGLFTISALSKQTDVLTATELVESRVQVSKVLPSPDLNNDGALGFSDIAILLTRLSSSNMRYDLNGDGKVNMADVSPIRGR